MRKEDPAPRGNSAIVRGLCKYVQEAAEAHEFERTVVSSAESTSRTEAHKTHISARAVLEKPTRASPVVAQTCAEVSRRMAPDITDVPENKGL